jgi:hypothetical protein
MDLPKREEFLSQVGSFTQEQRRIFHRICDFYDPALDYNRFVLHAGKDILFANNQIEILMKKLKTAHYGLLQFHVHEGELKPEKIIVSNRDSKEYYAALIDDEIQRILIDEARSFLTLEELEEMNQRVPFDMVDSISPELLGPRAFGGEKNSARILSLHLKSGGSLLMTGNSAQTVIGIGQLRIRNALKNTSFITIMSRFMDNKISDIQKKMRTGDRRFWLAISTKILQNLEDLQLRFKHLESSLYQSAELLFHYYTNAVKQEEQERLENAAKDTAMEEVCMDILKKENFLVSDDDLMRLLEPHEKKWPGFKEGFYEKAVKVNTKIGLPLIISIGNKYIHRDHLYPYFRAELGVQAKELKYHYIQLMERMLRTNNRDKITIFYTRETFRDDVNDQLRNESPVLADLLSKPKILSEGIVHYFKNLKKVRDINKIKDFMNNFFDSGVIKFKDSDYLLNLYLLEIFDEAYKFLSVWRKFLLKLSGKKESFRSQYSGLDENGKEKGEVYQRKETAPAGAGESMMVYDRQGPRRTDSGKSSTQYRRRRSNPSQLGQKQYSLKQRNKAWLEFEDAFQRKKK